MYLGYRRLTIRGLLAALFLCAANASFGAESSADCAQILIGNVRADGTLANDTYHRGVIIPKGSILGFNKHCEGSWADTTRSVNYKGVQLAAFFLPVNI